jgi:hypothetical protein
MAACCFPTRFDTTLRHQKKSELAKDGQLLDETMPAAWYPNPAQINKLHRHRHNGLSRAIRRNWKRYTKNIEGPLATLLRPSKTGAACNDLTT